MLLAQSAFSTPQRSDCAFSLVGAKIETISVEHQKIVNANSTQSVGKIFPASLFSSDPSEETPLQVLAIHKPETAEFFHQTMRNGTMLDLLKKWKLDGLDFDIPQLLPYGQHFYVLPIHPSEHRYPKNMEFAVIHIQKGKPDQAFRFNTAKGAGIAFGIAQYMIRGETIEKKMREIGLHTETITKQLSAHQTYILLRALGYIEDYSSKDETHFRRLDRAQAEIEFETIIKMGLIFDAYDQSEATAILASTERTREASIRIRSIYIKIAQALKVLSKHHPALNLDVSRSGNERIDGLKVEAPLITALDYLRTQMHYVYDAKLETWKPPAP